ncbi:MAG: zf-HC2 domain-containing protein [Acidimicrobiia bacterium]
MDCEHCRMAVSARLDGEDTDVSSVALHAHLAECAACRDFEGATSALHRSVRVAPAPPVPDLTSRILGAIGEEPARPSTHRDAWRAALAVVALIQIALALPALLLGNDAGLPVHTARHLGSFAVALGVGFLVVAWKPSRAPGLFPLAAALVACLVLTSAIDIVNGRTRAFNELAHSTELLGLALCWLVGRTAAPDRRAAGRILSGAA